MNEFYQENNLLTVTFLYNANAIFSELQIIINPNISMHILHIVLTHFLRC